MRAASSPRAASRTEVVSVLVVDDSAVIRGMTRRWLEENPNIEVIASAADGERMRPENTALSVSR